MCIRDRLKEVARPLRDAGVTHLNISLDTLNEERFRAITRLGTLQDTLDGICLLYTSGHLEAQAHLRPPRGLSPAARRHG